MTGAPRSLCHQSRNELCLEVTEKEPSNYTNASQSILYISVLIAAGSFAAAFTVPGGYIAEGEDAGLPIISGTNGFIDFVVNNSASFFISTTATCMLVHASLTNIRTRDRRYYLSVSALLAYEAVLLMVITFTSVLRLTLNPATHRMEYIILCLTMVLDVILCFAFCWPLMFVTAPRCLRVAMRLRTSKNPRKDILHILSGAIGTIYGVLALIILLSSSFEKGLSPRKEFRYWRWSVSQGGEVFPYPT